MASETLRIATRRSALALCQSETVAALLREVEPGLEVELVPMTTKGDQILDSPLARIGGKGLFVKELEHAMLSGAADIAVHSMKDVPAELPDGLCVPVILPREDPRDAFLSVTASAFDELPEGARVGTSSLRRQSQLLALRPDLVIETLRGNVDTRLRRLESGDFDAILLACAGLRRLGLAAHITEALSESRFLPAIGQGAVGIETRDDDPRVLDVIARLDHPVTRTCVSAERAMGRQLGASCQVPLGGHARLEGETLSLEALLATPDGKRLLRASATGTDPHAVGRDVADALFAQGAGEILDALRAEHDDA